MQKNYYFGQTLIFFSSRDKIGTLFDVSFVTVPVSALVHPLCVISESFTGEDTVLVVLPKQNWSQFFGDYIYLPYHL